MFLLMLVRLYRKRKGNRPKYGANAQFLNRNLKQSSLGPQQELSRTALKLRLPRRDSTALNMEIAARARGMGRNTRGPLSASTIDKPRALNWPQSDENASMA